MSITNITGIYRHYKGHEYEVLYVAVHTETEERLVVYRNVNDESLVWARPYDMFFEDVIVDGKSMPRFAKVSKKSH